MYRHWVYKLDMSGEEPHESDKMELSLKDENLSIIFKCSTLN